MNKLFNSREDRRKSRAEQARLDRAYLKDLGICVRCGQRPVIPDMTLCSVCREKHNQWMRGKNKRTPEQQAKDTERRRNLRKARTAAGLCAYCGQEKALPGLLSCCNCRLYINQRASGARVYHTEEYYTKERLAGRL